jgi:hypothetical protein
MFRAAAPAPHRVLVRALSLNAQHRALLVAHSQWTETGADSPLRKVFDFRDARAATTFTARVADLALRLRVDIPVVVDGDVARRVTAADESLALGVDDVAAELQLGGNGKWS